jgi:hypothetical protein
VTIINTNISTNFIKYINRFVNVFWTKPELLRINALGVSEAMKKVMRRDLYKQMKKIKDSIINNDIELCPLQYRQELQQYRVFDELLPTIKPERVDENGEIVPYNAAYDVKVNTMR